MPLSSFSLDTTMDAWISALWTGRLVDAAVALGATAAPLWKRAGLAPEQMDADVRIADAAHLLVWEDIMRELRLVSFPTRFGRMMKLDDYEVLGFACKTASTLGEAFERITRYLTIWTNAVDFEVAVTNARARLMIHRDGERTLGARCSAESGLVELAGAVRTLEGSNVELLAAFYRHPAPSDVSELVAHFGCDVHFDAAFDGFELDASVLERPLPLADEGLSRFLIQHLERRARAAPGTDVLADVTRAISDELPSGGADISRVAARLGLSPRTLQRRLSDAGSTFQDVVVDTREALARRLLTESDHTISEIAFLLGFSEPSAFHRAFRRWVGMTPGAFRREQ